MKVLDFNNKGIFLNKTTLSNTEPIYVEKNFIDHSGYKEMSTSFKDFFVTNLYKNEFFDFLNSSKVVKQNVFTNGFFSESWFYTYNSLISLVFLITVIFLIGLFLPKTPKGISILNILSAFVIVLFLFILPIPYYSMFKNLIWFNYNLYVYIYILIGGIFTAGFLALNNEITFLKENKHIEYPLLILLVFLSGIVVVASENFIAVFLALEAITLISAVLIGFQKTNNLSTLAGVRYIFFSAIPGGALVLGLSEIYAYTGAFNFADIEKLLITYEFDAQNNGVEVQQILYNSLMNVLDYSWDIKFQNYMSFLSNSLESQDKSLCTSILKEIQQDNDLVQFINYNFITNAQENNTNFVLSFLGESIFMDNGDMFQNIKRGKFLIYQYIDLLLYENITTTFLLNWSSKINNLPNLFKLMDDVTMINLFLYDWPNSMQELAQSVSTDLGKNIIQDLIPFNQNNSLDNQVESVKATVVANTENVVNDLPKEKSIDVSKIVLNAETQNSLFQNGMLLIKSIEKNENVLQSYNNLYKNFTHLNLNQTLLTYEYLNTDSIQNNCFNNKDFIELKNINNFYKDNYTSYEVNTTIADQFYNFLNLNDNQMLTKNKVTLTSNLHSNEVPLIINVSIFLIIFYILFKLTAAPFHMWAPSIYEGAPLPITIFLSIFSKITMIFLLIKLLIFYFYFIYSEWSTLLIMSGIGSIIVGIYGAISETRIKRFFVYSSMGHVGFMLLGIAEGSIHGVSATFLYLIIYTITVFIGWTILFSSVNKVTHINQLNGLSKTNPVLSFILAISMLSMSGIPPLAGFFVKFEILYALIESEFYSVALLALLLTVFSFFYYLRIIKILYFEPVKSFKLQYKLNKTQAFLLTICFLLLVNFTLYFQQPFIYCIKNIVIQSLY